jgi:hypothetical protein
VRERRTETGGANLEGTRLGGLDLGAAKVTRIGRTIIGDSYFTSVSTGGIGMAPEFVRRERPRARLVPLLVPQQNVPVEVRSFERAKKKLYAWMRREEEGEEEKPAVVRSSLVSI